MLFFILIVCFFIFLFCLYKLTKDDYLFIRKNIYPEQMFDIIFIVIWSGLFASRFIYLLQHPLQNRSALFLFFSLRYGGFSLIGGVIGGLLALYLMGKYRKVPFGRLFDFFNLAFLFSLPVGFTGYALLLRNNISLLYFAVSLLYLTILIIFLRFLYPRIMNRTLREGSLSIYFFLLFSVIQLLTSILVLGKVTISFITIENVSLICLFFICLIVAIKNERGRIRGKGVRR